MTDEELIARLRDWQEHDDGKINDAREAAADRIEAQAAEIERLRVDLAKAVEERDEALNQLDSARHSVDVLEKRVAKLMGANP
jgi:chromosome segregation ATPase